MLKNEKENDKFKVIVSLFRSETKSRKCSKEKKIENISFTQFYLFIIIYKLIIAYYLVCICFIRL